MLACIGGAGFGQAPSDSPLSAIGWLSDSIALPSETVQPDETAPITAAVPSLTVAPLDSDVPDIVGTISYSDLGLPKGLWSRNSAGELAQRLTAMPEIKLPGLRDFYAQLIAARFAPPADAILDERFYLARVDSLMGLARFDDAQTLLRAAGTEDPERFRRFFDIGLLTGTEDEACQMIDDTPEVSPTFPARIFCLARNGEWDVAALTLGTAEALGILTNQEDQLLMRFLDPDLFEDDPLPAPDGMSPLLFRLYEAIGERPLTDQLPVAFAITDMSETVGWKDRLAASEKLAAIGAIAPEVLIETMNARKPAASGGIWARVKALQAFDRAAENDVAESLLPAWDAASDGGYAATLAPWFLGRIANADLPRAAHHTAFEIALLAGDTDAAKRWSSGRAGDQDLLALAENRPSEFQARGPLETSIRQSLAGLPPSPSLRSELDAGRAGTVLLDAVAVLAEGAEGDPRAIGDALAVLMALELDDVGRRVAVDLMLDASRI